VALSTHPSFDDYMADLRALRQELDEARVIRTQLLDAQENGTPPLAPLIAQLCPMVKAIKQRLYHLRKEANMPDWFDPCKVREHLAPMEQDVRHLELDLTDAEICCDFA
jgi:hypothetical protein